MQSKAIFYVAIIAPSKTNFYFNVWEILGQQFLTVAQHSPTVICFLSYAAHRNLGYLFVADTAFSGTPRVEMSCSLRQELRLSMILDNFVQRKRFSNKLI